MNTQKPNIKSLPGGWEPLFKIELNKILGCGLESHNGILIFKNILSKDECENMIKEFMQSPNFENVSIHGRKDVPDDRTGSIRTTAWCPQLAEELWTKKLSELFIETITFNEKSPTDWWQGDKTRTHWKSIGISPMMRFMKYEKDGQHFAHYDAAYIYPNDNIRTLFSMVIYLTTNENGGSTRFIKDDQDDINVWDRDHKDWIREVVTDEVLFSSKPIQGNILIFPHRMCHDVEKYIGESPRIIIRGDVICESIN
jgi:hypothetical protein